MYELIQVGTKSFFMDCPAKVGMYLVSTDEVVLIDSGSDKDAAKKVKKILDEKGWKLKAIFNTHSHADHIGGNQYLQAQTGCKIYAYGVERSIAQSPILEPTYLYGGCSFEELRNKFLMAKESLVEEMTEDVLPKRLEMIKLPGHSFDMVGFRTDDDVIYIADSLSSKETLEKYQIGYLYDVKAYLETLEFVKTLSAKAFVPAHAGVTENISDLAQLNIDKTKEISEKIRKIIKEPKTFEEIQKEIFDIYHISMNEIQYVLIGSTIKSYLGYLKGEGKAKFFFEDNRMLWQTF